MGGVGEINFGRRVIAIGSFGWVVREDAGARVCASRRVKEPVGELDRSGLAGYGD